MTAVARGLEAALVHGVWQDAAVAALLWAILLLLKNSSANARYVACCAGLALDGAAATCDVRRRVRRIHGRASTRRRRRNTVALPRSPQCLIWPRYTQTRSRIWTNLSLSERSRLAFLQPWILPLMDRRRARLLATTRLCRDAFHRAHDARGPQRMTRHWRESRDSQLHSACVGRSRCWSPTTPWARARLGG